MSVLSKEAVELAVEVTKAGIPMQSGTMMPEPETVAKFIEVVATKIHELRFGKS